MYLAFLIISALDLLDSLDAVSTKDERRDYVDWIYHCQHPKGGFRGWPGCNFDERANETNVKWDAANVPSTYFALGALRIVGDDLKRVHRKQTLQWLAVVLRESGTFGEHLVDGQIEGGRDPRSSFCATGIRYMLRGAKAAQFDIDGEQVQDIDVDALVQSLRDCEVSDIAASDTVKAPQADRLA